MREEKLLCSRNGSTFLERITSPRLRSLATMITVPHSASNDNPDDDYVVYALIDQRDFSVFYIGITDDVYARFYQHLRCDGTNPAKDVRIIELRKANVMLMMKTLETMKGVERARERETFWIHHYRFLGASLLNIAIPVIHIPKIVQPHLFKGRRPANYGRKHKDGGVKTILLYYIQHGEWPDDVSDDMRWYYTKHYIKRGGKYYRKFHEWEIEQESGLLQEE